MRTLPFVDENLVAVGGELSVPSLLRAYRSGSFPWTVHPVTWWSPDPRAIMELHGFHLSHSFRKFLKKEPFTCTLDRQFDAVIDACAAAAPNRRTTWITPEFITAYKEMHRGGHAHSLEVLQDGELAGGIYGVAIGGYFAGESMFHRVSNASKAALYFLTRHLAERNFLMLDVQMPTHITLQLGATLIPRAAFLKRLREAQAQQATFT